MPYLTLYFRNSFGKLDVVGLWELRVNTDPLALLPALLILVLETTKHVHKDIDFLVMIQLQSSASKCVCLVFSTLCFYKYKSR